MNQEDLETELSRFEISLKVRIPALGGLTEALREIFATESAYLIVSYFHAHYPEEIESARRVQTATQHKTRPMLPRFEAVQREMPRILETIKSNDPSAAITALKEAGILSLCPSDDLMFEQLELSVDSVMGMAQILPLIALAFVAIKIGAFDRAGSYVVRANALAPGAPELHDLHTISGMLALNNEDVSKAKEFLLESVHVCERNEFSCLSCALHPYNLLLAEKLIGRGEREVVVQYLSRCREVWKQGERQLAPWIEEIKSGQQPHFVSRGMRRRLDSPSVKMRWLATRSSFMSQSVAEELTSQKSIREVRESLDEMRANQKRQVSDAIKGKLDFGRN
ncbi:MAG: hypothetical protein WB679_23835 [Terracidiphilus sp.]